MFPLIFQQTQVSRVMWLRLMHIAPYLILYDLRFDLQEMLHQRIWATHLTPHNLCQITIHRLTCPTKDHAFPMDGPPSLVITTYFLNSSIVENNN